MSIESVEAMSRVFREQHRQMIDEQKKLLEDYRQYFDGVLRQVEERDRMAALAAAAAASKPTEDEEDPVKEIAEIGALLDEAVKVYGRELADIIIQLTDRQRKKAESLLDEEEITEVDDK
jgi:hypothetical protein